MRSLEDARDNWQVLQQYHDLRQLKDAIRIDSNASLATTHIRSVLWKVFLLFDSLDTSEWQRILVASRSAYNSLRAHFFRYIDNPDEVADFDPLGQNAESSPWSQMHKDEELRAEILQDVERIGTPNAEYFQQGERQQILLDVLFIFCKLNPDVGYRQGMHEIAAPILYVVENEAVEIGGISKILGEDVIIKNVLDAEHIEHDTFALFGQIMQNAKNFYHSEGPISITTRSKHIFNDLLPQVDPDLVKHLEGMDIVPQVFLIRWIRLLFGREFDFDAVLALWDVMFAEDTSLEMVDHVCLVMLLRIRWHLLDSDYNNALSLLLRYPELDKDFPAQTFAVDAMYLKNHMTTEGGSYLVLKYTGRPLAGAGRPSTPPALQRNITTFAIRQVAHPDRKTRISPTRATRQSNNIEALLQSTAKNLYSRGEKLGIGKAVRTAVDEVHKKAQEIREAQLTSSPPSWRRSGNVRLLDQVRELEQRNKKLATLLAGAVNELWNYQRLVSEQQLENSTGNLQAPETVEMLSTAIAKVQFVQVYLEEPTLSLDDTSADHGQASDIPDSIKQGASEPAIEITAQETSSADLKLQSMAQQADKLADPPTFGDTDKSDNTLAENNATVISNHSSTLDSSSTSITTENESGSKSKASRPLLEQSAFSFMLDSKEGGTTAHASLKRIDDSLFGGHRRDYSASKRTALSADANDNDNEGASTDEFDISSLRRAKAGKR